MIAIASTEGKLIGARRDGCDLRDQAVLQGWQPGRRLDSSLADPRGVYRYPTKPVKIDERTSVLEEILKITG
jgi:hypothetical protein